MLSRLSNVGVRSARRQSIQQHVQARAAALAMNKRLVPALALACTMTAQQRWLLQGVQDRLAPPTCGELKPVHLCQQG